MPNTLTYTSTFSVPRTVTIREVLKEDESYVWKVEVRDGDRKPFMTKFFDSPDSAYDFAQKLEHGKNDHTT